MQGDNGEYNETELTTKQKAAWIGVLCTIGFLVLACLLVPQYQAQQNAIAERVATAQRVRREKKAIAAAMVNSPQMTVARREALPKKKGHLRPIYIVSDAGESEWNGIYEEDGTSNGYPAYSLNATHWLARDPVSGNWAMGPDPSMSDSVVYVGSSNAPSPPTGTWKVILGSPPAPTVTASGVTGALTPSKVRPSNRNQEQP